MARETTIKFDGYDDPQAWAMFFAAAIRSGKTKGDAESIADYGLDAFHARKNNKVQETTEGETR